MNRKERRRQQKAQPRRRSPGSVTPNPPSSPGSSQTLFNYATGAAPQPALPVNPLSRAVQFLQSGQPEEARKICDRELIQDPQNGDVNHLAGLVYSQLGDLSKAVTLLETAAALAPDQAEAQANLAMALDQSGRTDDAEAAYRRAIRMQPSFVEALYNLGRLLAGAGKLDEATEYLRRAATIEPSDADIQALLGGALLDQGRGPEAESALTLALECDPRHVAALRRLSDVKIDAAAWEEAEALLRRAIEIAPEDATLHSRLGYVLHSQDDFENAVGAYEVSLKQNPLSADTIVNLGQALQELGRLDDAVERYREAMRFDPELFLAHANLGRALGELEKPEDAVIAFQNAIALEPDDTATLFQLGATLRGLERHDEAVPIYRRALEIDTDYSSGHWELGHTLESCGDVEGAIASYETCLAADPDNPVARHLLAALTGETTAAAPTGYIEDLFDDYASSFDNSLLEDLGYVSPERIRELLDEMEDQPAGEDGKTFSRALDLGCGTGLVGEKIRDLVDKLVGVDLSEKMLAIADKKNIYDSVHQAELVAFLTTDAGRDDERYDLMVAGDVLTYFGSLATVFAAARPCLVENAPFIFTVEAMEEGSVEAFLLRPSGRYAHSEDYLYREAKHNGFKVERISRRVIRNDGDEPIEGFLCQFRNP